MIDAALTGKIISTKRKEKGLTQLQLAQLLNISNRTVSKWENGDGFPDITLLPDIAQQLDITIDELLTGVKPEPIIEIREIEIKSDKNDYKKSREKFLISEIIAFCFSIGANAIGGTTELMLFKLRPFYAFIEIYLMVATVVLFIAAIIIFLTGYVKFKADTNKINAGILTELYAFTVITSITPAFTAFRILSRLFTDTGYFLRYAFLVIYIIALIAFTVIMVKKIRSIKNDD
ncbi:MAG: helix-turn-helix domain-containing protein [Eubacterium sp.]